MKGKQLILASILAMLTMLLLAPSLPARVESSPVVLTRGARQVNSPAAPPDLLGFFPKKVHPVDLPHLLNLVFEGMTGAVPITGLPTMYPLTSFSMARDRAKGAQPAPSLIGSTYQWHTFMGSSSWDYGNGVTVDGSGNVYVTGFSNATWNGPGGIAPLNPYAGDWDIVVLKLNSSGAYQWHTFMGSADGGDSGNGITVDGSGNVYVTGSSAVSWSGPGSTPPLNAFAGDGNIVVLKLNSSGAYQWHTFMGGSAAAGDYGRGIAVDGSGNAYVTGSSAVSWSGPGLTPPLNAYAGGDGDIVVLKLNSSGAYQWHTFLGGGSYDYGQDITVGESGNVYVTGSSDTTWNGPGSPPPLNAYAGLNDIVVLKLNSSGAYQWHTFMGGASYDYGSGITLAASGDLYVTAFSRASWNGPGSLPALNTYAGLNDIVVLKLNSSGAYQWHTFLGSASWDVGSDITADESGNVYVTGTSDTTWNGPGSTPPINAYAGLNNIVVLKLNSSGAYQWHTFLGSWDSGSDIAVDGSGNVYVTGNSSVTWNGPGSTPPLNAYAGGFNDIVVLHMFDPIPLLTLTKTVDNPKPSLGQRITYTIIINNYGLISATNALISDTLPSTLAFAGPVTLDPLQPNAIRATSPLSLPALASNLTISAQTSITLTLPVTVNVDVNSTAIINTAAVTSAKVSIPVTGLVRFGGEIYLPIVLKNG